MKKLKSAICLAVFLTATGLSAQDLGDSCEPIVPGPGLQDGYCLFDQATGGYYCDQFFENLTPPDCSAYLIVT